MLWSSPHLPGDPRFSSPPLLAAGPAALSGGDAPGLVGLQIQTLRAEASSGLEPCLPPTLPTRPGVPGFCLRLAAVLLGEGPCAHLGGQAGEARVVLGSGVVSGVSGLSRFQTLSSARALARTSQHLAC